MFIYQTPESLKFWWSVWLEVSGLIYGRSGRRPNALCFNGIVVRCNPKKEYSFDSDLAMLDGTTLALADGGTR